MGQASGNFARVVREALPSAYRTAVWIIKITVIVSFVILLLDYVGFINLVSSWLDPTFHLFGLPGEASLAFLSGYFVNVYTAIAIVVTLDLDIRATTILGVMVLCAHNMIAETAVQKKTGTSFVRIMVVRTLSSFCLAFVLNLLLPGKSGEYINTVQDAVSVPFMTMFFDWLVSMIHVVAKMTVLIFSLSILNRVLSEYGVIEWLCKHLKPVMHLFGLPVNTGFLWIVANTLGLAYGAAVLMDEVSNGNVSQHDADLLNHHICISHSNLEDLFLFASVGASVGVMLVSRWVMACILVWERRLELKLRHRYTHAQQ